MNRNRYSVSTMCLFFGVSRSGYYDYIKRMDWSAHNTALAEIIREQQDQCDRPMVIPVHEMHGLRELVKGSTILPQCIRAYKNNIAGFGIGVRYIEDTEETPEMAAEFQRAQEIIELLNIEQDTKEVFEDIVEARETYGIAYLEVIRNIGGEVVQIEFVKDTPSVRKTKPLLPYVQSIYYHHGQQLERKKRYCKYKQEIGGKTVYFKEFGDPRVMDMRDGKYLAEGETLELEYHANEIMEFAIGTEPYGEVRWITGSIILIVLCAVLLKSYQQKKRKDNGELARIKGQHIYGLSAQSEETVKAIVYQDKIVFKYAMSEETRSFQHITDVSFRSERTFVGQTTIAHRKTNLTSAISLGPRGGVTRTWIRTPETTYTTQDNYKLYWYLNVDTEDGSIMLRLKSYSNLDKFVGQCKACITQSNNGQNYADEYENSAEDDAYARPYARGRAYAADHSNDFESVDDEVIDIDKMDGATFEHFCADLLRVNGWTDVQITPASGDHGIDITAEKDDIKWGFQCKRWNGTKVDAVAIGQTYKGKALYECDIVAIITTSSFTRQAEDEARQLGIKLWRRAKIRQLMSKLENAEDYYLSA